MAFAGVLPSLVGVGCLLSLVVMGVALRTRPYRFARPIAVLAAGGTLWGLPYGIGFYAHDTSVHLALQGLGLLGAAVVPLGLLAVALAFVDIDPGDHRWVLGAVGAIPAITAIVLVTAPLHEFLWRTVAVTETAGLAVADVGWGPWIPVHLLWSYAVVALAFLLVLRRALDADTRLRGQAVAIVLVGGAPFALQLAAFGGFDWLGGVDPAPLLAGPSSAFVGMVLLVGNPIAIRPITRERLIEELRDGVVVLDTVGRLRECNPVARDLLRAHGVDPASTRGLPAELRDSGQQLEVTIEGEDRRFHTEVHAISDPVGHGAGTLVYYYDVTAVARREQRISILHRVLRHNIRNEMTVLLGHLDYIERAIDPAHADDVAAVERSADRIVGFAENARLIERSLKQGERDHVIEMSECVREALEDIRYRHPAATISLALDPEDGPHFVSGVDRELLLGAVQELLDNAVVHGSPPVEVRIRHGEDWVDVEFLDEGPGIPEAEIEALETPVETSLEHGSGLGLWVARWAAGLSGGELRFDHEHGRNVVRLRLPPADDDAIADA